MKNSTFIKGLALVAAWPLPLILGCSPGHGLDLARVQGKVTFNGEPVKKGTVHFYPDESKGTVGPSGGGGITDGVYVASTDSSGDGVIVGTHKVGLSGVEAASVSNTAATDPEKLSTAEHYQVKGGMVGRGARPRDPDLFTDARGNKWRYVVPKKLSDPNQSGVVVKIERGSNTVNFEISEDGQVKVSN